MADYQWDATCDEPDCDCCRLGARLVEALREVDVDTETVVLTLIRMLATIAASVSPDAQPRVFAGMVHQLREDVTLLLSEKAVH
jgi:hypothetical protein